MTLCVCLKHEKKNKEKENDQFFKQRSQRNPCPLLDRMRKKNEIGFVYEQKKEK